MSFCQTSLTFKELLREGAIHSLFVVAAQRFIYIYTIHVGLYIAATGFIPLVSRAKPFITRTSCPSMLWKSSSCFAQLKDISISCNFVHSSFSILLNFAVVGTITTNVNSKSSFHKDISFTYKIVHRIINLNKSNQSQASDRNRNQSRKVQFPKILVSDDYFRSITIFRLQQNFPSPFDIPTTHIDIHAGE